MTTIRLGCQLHPWEAAGERYMGQLPHIAERASQAGFDGIETDTVMLGAYYDDPEAMEALLNRYDLRLVAMTLALPCRQPEETADEREAADRLFAYLGRFARSQLILVPQSQPNAAALEDRQEVALACLHAVAERASEQGIMAAVKPEPGPDALFRTPAGYRRLIEALDPRVLGLALDTGYVARLGMDVMDLLRSYRPLVRHVYFRDVGEEGSWQPLGQGMLDLGQIVRLLQDSCYNGWVIADDISPAAVANPDVQVLQDGNYLKQLLAPLA